MAGGHQRRDTHIVGSIHIGPKFHEKFDDLQPFSVGFPPAITVDPCISGGLHQCRLGVAGGNVGVSAIGQQELDQFQICGKCGTRQCGSERGSRRQIQSGSAGGWNIVDERIRIGSRCQEFFDQRKRVGSHHPRHTGVRFHIAPVDGPKQRSKPFSVGMVQAGLVVDEKRGNFVIPIVDRQL